MADQKFNRLKLTKRIVEGHPPDPSQRKLIWDTEITGFCVRIYPTGRKTYFFQYRNSYKETKFIKIGVHGNITTEQARDKATQLALRVSAGDDPSVKTPFKALNPTMEDLAEKYLKLHAETEKRPKSIKEDKSMLNNYILKEFGTRKVDNIIFEDIQELHASLNKKRILSNRILALLHKMFNLAVQWRWRRDNPVSGIKKYQEHKRTRWLQEDEMQRLLRVLDAYPNQVTSNIIRLLLLTGARKHEVLQATWDQFDLDKGVWTKRAHTTKQKKMEHSPLSPSALIILREIEEKKTDSPFLFPGNATDKPLQDFKKSWNTIRKRADLKDFTIHDLRHTFASYLVSSGLSLSIVGKLLGHTQASTTHRYAHLADDPLREATALFAEKFKELSNKKT
ncbi:MAG: site-specific integrase [Alphaproteobacteria bacterium]|nr:site-specific integrase [Alphaproteobacteria bacterium]